MINVLFLCTGNSARSILGEALLNHCGGSTFQAYSAGSDPTGQVKPLALEVLQRNGINTQALSSKSWDLFKTSNDVRIDIILTLCDDAANQPCPVWLDDGARCHWGLPDPAAAEGSQQQRQAAFQITLEKLQARINAILTIQPSLLNDSNARDLLEVELKRIHQQALVDE